MQGTIPPICLSPQMCDSLRLRQDPYVLHNLVLALKQQEREHEATDVYHLLLHRYEQHRTYIGCGFPLMMIQLS